MKRNLILLFTGATIAANAVVFPFPNFPTTPNWKEKYDSLAPGAYANFPIFSGNGIANRIGIGGALNVGPPLNPFTPPNGMFGRNVDVEIRVNASLRFFGGRFVQAPFGFTVTQATFKFYDVNNIFIGSGVAPITPNWTFIGWITFPKWTRVEIIGNASQPGYVGFDNTKARP